MKLSVMFIVFLMLTMPMTDGGIIRSANNGENADALAGDRATKVLELLLKSSCPPACCPTC
uniref:Conopeptide Mi041 n=1 Tax=Conus miles TaxID=69564 RepID=A0A0E3SVB7_CONMI|nr:conopeptide Mi041 [Conus miles]